MKVNARHYRRDIGDGVPRRTPFEFKTGLQEQMDLMIKEQGSKCRSFALSILAGLLLVSLLDFLLLSSLLSVDAYWIARILSRQGPSAPPAACLCIQTSSMCSMWMEMSSM